MFAKPSPDPTQPRSTYASFLAMLGICFVTMMVALDQTIIATAMPEIATELHGFELYAWVTTSYLLTSVITVPIFGSLGDFFGRRPFLILSCLLFTASSLFCGMSSSMEMLIFARAIQGIAGGMLIGTGFACVADLFPDVRVRLKWQVMISIAFGLSNIVGPSLGGFITEALGWRWIFLINLPVGMLSFFFVWRYIPHIRHQPKLARFHMDWPGVIFIVLALGSLQLGVEMLPKYGLSWRVLGLLVLSGVSFYCLWLCEKKAEQPIIPMGIMQHPTMNKLFLFSVMLGFVLFALLMYAPLLFQGGLGLTPRDAGLLITPLVVSITFASVTNNRIVTRIPKPNMMLSIGFIMIALCCVGLMLVQKSTSHVFILLVMVIGGLGMGFIMPNLTVFTQQVSPKAYIGVATGLIQSYRMVGGMLGAAMCGVIVTSMYTNQVDNILQSEQAVKWQSALMNPTILMDHAEQADVSQQLLAAGIHADVLFEQISGALINAVHAGFALALFIALVGFFLIRFIPHIELKSKKS